MPLDETPFEQALSDIGERRRIASELHDNVGQALTTLSVGLEALRSMETIESVRPMIGRLLEIAQRATQTVSELAHGLEPPPVRASSVRASIRELVEEHAMIHAKKLSFAFDVAAEGIELDRSAAVAAYQSLRETLNNIAKHAKASRIEVRVDRASGHLRIVLADDGVGFEPSSAHGGLGLRNIRERIAAAGGVVRIDSSPGKGTTVVLSIPERRDTFATQPSAHGFALERAAKLSEDQDR